MASQLHGKAPIRYGGVIAGQEEIDAVARVLRGQSWGCGEICAEFERQAAKHQDRAFALFVNSGSSALLLALATLPEGTRIAMPALQFPTLFAAALRWCRLEPVIVDIDDSLNLDPALIPDDVGAVAFVHVAGNPTNILEVAEFCRDRGITLIEDNCEGLGGIVQPSHDSYPEPGTWVGNFGALSCTSTHAAHQIATGEGGLVFCDDEALYWKMKRLRDWGRSYGAAKIVGYYDHYVFSELGLNLHASDIQAALGIVQLQHTREWAAQRRKNYLSFRRSLADLPIAMPRVHESAFPSWYTFPILTDRRDDLRDHLERQEIETRTILVGNLQRQPIGRVIEGDFPVADDVFRRGLWFSVHPRLGLGDRAHIIASVREFFA